jgi:NADP-dependent 3-hydroxy acid dehydrogenase YdfG
MERAVMTGVKDKVVILTGGAGDIAQVATTKLLDGGANVLLVDCDGERLAAFCDSLGSPAVAYCVADVTSEADTAAYVKAALDKFGGYWQVNSRSWAGATQTGFK